MPNHPRPMHPPVLDEHLAADVPGGDDPDDVDSPHVRLERVGVVNGTPVRLGHLDPGAPEERHIRLVPGHAEDEIIGDRHALVAVDPQDHLGRTDLLDGRPQDRPDRSLGDPVLDVGLHPVLEAGKPIAPVGEGHPRARPVQRERGLDRRALAPDDEHLLSVVRMSFREVIADFGQVLARDVEPVGMVVRPGGQDDLPGGVGSGLTGLRPCRDREIAVVAGDAGDLLVRPDGQSFRLGEPQVVSQGVFPRGLGIADDQRHVRQFDQLRGRVEPQSDRELVDGVDEAPFLDH